MLLWLFFIIMADGYDMQSIGFVAPEIARSWGLSLAALGPAFAAALAGAIPGAMMAGSIAMRIGRRPLLAVALLLFGGGTIGCVYAESITVLAAIRFFVGLGLGAAIPLVMSIAAQNVPEMRRRYLAAFGSTFNGLRREYDLDTIEYLAFVHDVPLEQFIQPQPRLSEMLGRLPLEKVIFTNADAPHARRVLAALGIAEHFPLIVDVHTMDFINKPDPRAYKHVLALTGAKPDESVFVDDRVANLQPAAELGMMTVLVHDDAAGLPPAGIDYQISSILEIEPIILANTNGGVPPIRPGTSQLNAPATAEGGA